MNTSQVGPSTDACVPAPAPARVWRRPARRLLAVAVAVVGALTGTGLVCWLAGPEAEVSASGLVPINAPAPPPANQGLPDSVFRGWPKPDMVVVISGQQHGYILPCGCSRPQVGGLERRYNFLRRLRAQGWPVVAIDLGDVPQKRGPVSLPNLQGLPKYVTSMKALEMMGYAAVGIGEYEASLPLFDALAEYALNEKKPRVVIANLMKADTNFPDMTTPWVEATDTTGKPPVVKVGVTSVVGPKVRAVICPPNDQTRFVEFSDSAKALNKALDEMKARGMELRILLYQGIQNGAKKPDDPPTEAVACAQRYPEFQLVVCLSEEDEPSANPTIVTATPPKTGRSVVLSVGHKGKYVGVLGVFRTGKPARPLEFRYQLVEMTEEYMTPKEEQDSHPITQLMEDYTRKLQRDNYLGKYGQTRHLSQALPPDPALPKMTPTYVGSEKCQKCHPTAYAQWKASAHSQAFDTLVSKAHHPSLRQHDAECVVCHVTGFGYQSGYTDSKRTPKLENVGCESCHGPSSIHAAYPDSAVWRERINPFRTKPGETAQEKSARILRADRFCQGCHDIDNDVHWKLNNGFEKHWELIKHFKEPKKER